MPHLREPRSLQATTSVKDIHSLSLSLARPFAHSCFTHLRLPVYLKLCQQHWIFTPHILSTKVWCCFVSCCGGNSGGGGGGLWVCICLCVCVSVLARACVCVCMCVCLDLVSSVLLVSVSMLFVGSPVDLLCLRIDSVLGQSVRWGLEVGVLFQRLALLGWCRHRDICWCTFWPVLSGGWLGGCLASDLLVLGGQATPCRERWLCYCLRVFFFFFFNSCHIGFIFSQVKKKCFR